MIFCSCCEKPLRLDDAVKDDRVAEDESTKMWNAAKNVFTA